MPQSFFKLYYHLIWSTKFRQPIITPAIEKILLDYLPGKIGQNYGSCLAINMTNDHLGNKAFYWQSGYGALSLSEKGIPFVKKYIANQKQHHARDNLLRILEYTPLDES